MLISTNWNYLPGMKAFTIISISDIDTLISRYWMRINRWSRVNAMLPFLLHFSVHHEKRIVRQVYRHLAFGICPQSRFLGYSTFDIIVSSNDLAHPELSGNSKTETADTCSRTKISQLIGMISNTLSTTPVTINKCGIRNPGIW